jgi:hypothetical protein
MTSADAIHEALAAWQPYGAGRHTWEHTLPADGWAVQLEAEKADAVGCVAWELAMTRTGPAPAGLTTRAWAERTAARVTGLLEPLKVVEVDDAAGEAILRSTSPSKKGPAVGYYEVALSGTSRATVRRYHADRTAGTPRSQVGFALTHEVLAKLVGDLITD